MDEHFDWGRIGDISDGRENLGSEMPVAVYRLLMYSMMDELTERFGKDEGNEIIRAIGFRSGRALAHGLLNEVIDFNTFVAELQTKMKELKVGVLRIESIDMEKQHIIMTVSEDLDCSGLPVTGETVCIYDEGLIAGLLYHATGKIFTVTEIDCWATGDRTCRFEATVAK
ncbi:MAG: 4-vinyl reductase [Clostridiales bacterium]|nr:4-vinyl reductase [Clostridiales bacterium]